LILTYNSANTCFRVINNYDSDTMVTQTKSSGSSYNYDYEILLSESKTSTGGSVTKTEGVRKSKRITANPYTGVILIRNDKLTTASEAVNSYVGHKIINEGYEAGQQSITAGLESGKVYGLGANHIFGNQDK